jgi:hypothetical protein
VEGDRDSANEILTERQGDALELDYWIGVIDSVNQKPIPEAKRMLTAAAERRPKGIVAPHVRAASVKSMSQRVLSATQVEDDSFPFMIADLRQRFVAQRDLARRQAKN